MPPSTVLSLHQGVSVRGGLEVAVDVEAGGRFKYRGDTSCPCSQAPPCAPVIWESVVISSVLFSLLSLGLPGQQQHAQVISLSPHLVASGCSSLSVPPHNRSAVSSPCHLLFARSFARLSPFLESQALPDEQSGQGRLSDLSWQLNRAASHLVAGWRSGRGGRKGPGPPRLALRDL